MVNVIIGIIVVILIIGALCAFFSFLWEHKVFTIISIIFIAVVVYCIKSEHPFDFLPIWGHNFQDFLWRITYKNTVFDAIWLYIGILFVVWLVAKGMLILLTREVVRSIVFTVISFASIILTYMYGTGWIKMVLVIETLISISVFWLFKVRTMNNIGLVKDVTDSLIKIEFPNTELGLLGLVILTNIIGRVNSFFETSIPIYMPSAIIYVMFIGIQLRWYLYVFKGYKFIVKYTKNNGFFCLEDYYNAEELSYLNDGEEYASSVTDILALKKKIYLMPFGDRYFINQQLKRNFEKSIKANLSSQEIKNSLNTDFREFGFEMVYKTIFSWVKGYEIDFNESEEAKTRRKSEIGIGATEFVLMRYPIEKHPLLKEGLGERIDYVTALNGLVQQGNIDTAKWEAKIEEYKKVFGVSTLSDDVNKAIDHFSRVIRRKESTFRTIKSDYSYLLLLEAIYFQNLLTDEDISYEEIESTFEQLKIKRSNRDFIYQYIKAMFIEGKIQEAENLLQSKLKTNVKRILEYVHYNIMWNERYVALNQYNVAVCATMSAGKSTFINAMLGTDYIPAKNEACTAKVTTIRDNDNLKKIIGCYTRMDNTKVYSNVIDGDVLSQWNDDTQVCETVLEGDLEEITCNEGILVMHDTPGTNNSEDSSHHNKTIEFLMKNTLDLVIYIINAEYISTNDTETLLKEIQEIQKNKNFQIVFGLNKIDCFDEEGDESLDGAIEGLHKQLLAYGFENPIIFPFSANAARLFKLVVKEKELTKREQRDFGKFMDKFSQFDASEHIVGTASESTSEAYFKLKKDKKIVIKDVEYSYNSIIEALYHTGILNIENWMSEMMKRAVQAVCDDGP